MPDKLTPADRLAILAELEHHAEEVSAIAVRLAELGPAVPYTQVPAEIFEDAARRLASGLWILQTPVRVFYPGAFATAPPDGHRER